jgi:cytochrome c551/c552
MREDLRVLLRCFNYETEKNMKAIVISMVAAGLFVTGSAMAEVSGIEMPAAAKKNNCTACHGIYRRLVGPAWLDVSRKYKGVAKFTYGDKEYPLLEGLMMKVSKGGSGSWGAMPMPANDAAGAKQAEIKELVTFVLGLDKAEADKLSAKKPEVKK